MCYEGMLSKGLREGEQWKKKAKLSEGGKESTSRIENFKEKD